MNSSIRKANIAIAIVGLLVGAALIAMGIVVICTYSWTYIPAKIYGGDFYTDIYAAVEELGNAIDDLFYLFQISLGTIMLLGGVLIELHYIRLIVSSKKIKDDSNNTCSKARFDTKPSLKNHGEIRDISVELEKIHELYTKGILTEEEFNTQKQRILD